MGYQHGITAGFFTVAILQVVSTMSNKPKIILIFLLIALAVGTFLYFSKMDAVLPSNNDNNANNGSNTGQNGGAVSSETVKVTETNITGGGASKLPDGFPPTIPVETINVKESYKVDYTDKEVTQYTVSYVSIKDSDELWTIYNDFMAKERYMIDTETTSRNLGQITGFSGNDSLSVVISTQKGSSLVQMNLLVRQ